MEWFILVVAVWAILGVGLARENERVVKIFLGRPYGVAESGPYWVPYGLAWVKRYTTKVVELHFAQRDDSWNIERNAARKPLPAGGFISARGNVDGKEVGPVNIGVTLSFYFRWPQTRVELFECVKQLPDPQDTRGLTDLFQEIILDETRSVGCRMNYIELMRDRAGFARLITQSVSQGQASQLLVQTGIDVSARVVIDHIDVPQETLDAIDDEEAARLRAEGTIRTAEGQKKALKLEGEGRAAGIEALKAQGPEAMEYESLRTLREMAQGSSNTIFFPFEGLKKLFSNLGKSKGGGPKP